MYGKHKHRFRCQGPQRPLTAVTKTLLSTVSAELELVPICLVSDTDIEASFALCLHHNGVLF